MTSFNKLTYVPPPKPDVSQFPLLDVDTLPQTVFWRVLGTAVSLRRDYKSKTEAAFTAWLANRLPVTLIDAAGNVHVDLRTLPTHRTMFTSHTDTVHAGGGKNNVRVDGNVWRADTGAALGADDAAGIAIMCHMIDAGVQGYYVFFRGEERGGVGSTWLAENMPTLFVDIDRAIAFDRGGFYDVITHQMHGRCCSDKFAQALCNELSTEASWYMPSSSGVYTDTAEFIELVPECTNISVGYENQHGDQERQDVDFLWRLAQKCLAVEWDALPTVRDPKVVERWDAWNNDDMWYTSYQTVEDDKEEELWGALDAATDSRRSQHRLRELIAEAMYPSDPSIGLGLMTGTRLSAEQLDDAIEMLSNGWESQQVLETLFELAVYP